MGAVSRKMHTMRCRSSTEENKRRYKSIKNKARKTVSDVMRELAEEVLTEYKFAKMGC